MLQAAEKYEENIKNLIEKAKKAKDAVKPVMSINTAEEREKMF